jgi:aryl-alcohol dehydrogenase-like predicted oxidoreductase
LLIPGTSSLAHVGENISAADLDLSNTAFEALDRGTEPGRPASRSSQTNEPLKKAG